MFRLGMADVVSVCRQSTREPAGHRAARRVERIPLRLVGQGWNGDDLPLVETGEGGVDRVRRRQAGDVPELRRRRPGLDCLDQHALARELMMERLAEG